jgi:hypothetical protein
LFKTCEDIHEIQTTLSSVGAGSIASAACPFGVGFFAL